MADKHLMEGTMEPVEDSERFQYTRTLGLSARRSVETAYDKMLQYIDTVPAPRNGVFTIADYGTFDGYTSLHLMKTLIRRIRFLHGQQLQVQIVYEDREENDYNKLFKTVHELSQCDNVYLLATNRNFYQQCVPDESCDVIISLFACHWLRESSRILTDATLHVTSTSPEEVKRFDEMAAQDWQDFLLLRAKELKPGGLLAVVVPSAVEDYRSKLKSICTPRNTPEYVLSMAGVYPYLEASWTELKEQGVILEVKMNEDEYRNSVINMVFRTPRETIAPLVDKSSPVSQAGLHLLSHEQIVVPCVNKDKWREKLEKEGIDDRRMFAAQTAAAHRVWSYSGYYKGLSHMRSTEEKRNIMNRLYEVFMAKVFQCDPDTFQSEGIVSKLFAQKTVN